MNQRSPIAALILSLLVPLYVFYWLYDVAKWMRRIGVDKVPFLVPVLTAMAAYLTLFVGLMLAGLLRGESSGSNTVFLVLFAVAAVLVPVVWVLNVLYYYKFSKAISTVVHVDMGPGLLTLIFVLIAAVPVYLIQEKLNQLPAAGAQSQGNSLPNRENPVQ